MQGLDIGANGTKHFGAEWVAAHEALSRLAKDRARAEAEEGRWLLAALRSAAHAHLGFGSFGEYVGRLFGYKPRTTQEKLRVAEALEALPAIATALEQGSLHWSAAREVTRVATPETEQEWLDIARGKTVHELEALVAGKIPGDRPSSPNRSSVRRLVLRFEVTPETLALFREAMNALGRRSGGTLDDDSALLLMAREVLGGPRDEGRANYQVALTVCPECRNGNQQACGELVPLDAELVAMAECDGQLIGPLPIRAANGNAPLSADAGSADKAASDARNARAVDVGAVGGRTRASGARVGARAKQTISPATRRAVLRRDHGRCVVPGCRNARFVDVHHLELRSEGGTNDADNLVTLCGAHHRAVHRGQIVPSGRVSTGLRFRHADGGAYGRAVSPRSAAAQAKAFAALRGLGFREAEVCRALDELRDNDSEHELALDRVIREALARLCQGRGER